MIAVTGYPILDLILTLLVFFVVICLAVYVIRRLLP